MLIRRWDWVRPCFGLKARVKTQQPIMVEERALIA